MFYETHLPACRCGASVRYAGVHICESCHDDLFMADELRWRQLPTKMLTQDDRLSVVVTKLGSRDLQGIGYLTDRTMVVIENGSCHLGREVVVRVNNREDTGYGQIVFCELIAVGPQVQSTAAVAA